MRRALAAAAALGLLAAASACFTPPACTRALCPAAATGSYRVDAWRGSIVSSPDLPMLPVVPDSRVEILSGTASFAINGATVTAPAGAAFGFAVSNAKIPVPSITVSSGTVTVALPGAAPAEVAAGRAVDLPAPRK